MTGSHVWRECSSTAQAAEGTHVQDPQSSEYEGNFLVLEYSQNLLSPSHHFTPDLKAQET